MSTEFVVEKRDDKWVIEEIDIFKQKTLRVVDSFRTQKQADNICMELNKLKDKIQQIEEDYAEAMYHVLT